MEKIKLTDKHFCYVLFLEMSPEDFSNLMKTNGISANLVMLNVQKNVELYQEAKDLIENKDMGSVYFDFDYDSEPFVFDKYINGKLDRTYKICIFEVQEENKHTGSTSDIYFDGMPQFFGIHGEIIKNSLN